MRETNDSIRRYSIAMWTAAICMLVVFAAAAVTGFIFINREKLVHRNALENNYQRAMYDMEDSVSSLEVNLSKLMITEADKESYTLISDTLNLAEMAENSLSHLPLSRENTIDASKYFHQVSDWCRSYMRSILAEKDTEAFTDQAEELYIVARNINENLRAIRENIGDRPIYSAIGEGRVLSYDINIDISKLNEQTVEYPELIYDGPFSDGKKYTFKALEGLAEIDEAGAIAIASKTFDLSDAVCVGTTTGNIDTFEILATHNGEDVDVSVTKQGGRIIQYNKNRDYGAVAIEEAAAGKAAVRLAEKLGYEYVEPVWYGALEGLIYVNLAPVVDDVVYYTDLVKVKVAADTGEVMGLEATGYCRCYSKRDYSPTMTEKAARALVSKKLTINDSRLCVIPKGDDEVFCYEYACEYKGLDYYVYLDAHDGHQVNLLRVVDANQGKLVM